jgi:hypothetical protein
MKQLNSDINISKSNIQGKCDLKCFYNFKYSESNLTAKNNGVMISLAYDNATTPPVIYNNEKYTVSTISIVSPSIHIFNGTKAVGEIIIEHTPVTGGSELHVAIPFTSSSESITASNLLTEVINDVAANAPSNGESTNLNISGFTLQSIVPKKPFYSYTSDDHKVNWIVFDILDAIPLSSTTLTTLSSIIQPFHLPTDGSELFYNSTGPNASNIGSDGIYISCQPTGSSKESSAVMYDKNPTYTNFGALFSNPQSALLLEILLGIIGFIVVFVGLNYAYSYFTSDAPKLPALNPFSKIYKKTT